MIISRELSVRATEELVKKLNTSVDTADEEKVDSVEREYYHTLSKKITTELGNKVNISHRGNKKSITISYNSTDELEKLIEKLIGAENTEKLFV